MNFFKFIAGLFTKKEVVTVKKQYKKRYVSKNGHLKRDYKYNFNGKRLKLKEACALYGVSYGVITKRIASGMAVDEAFKKPIKAYKNKKQKVADDVSVTKQEDIDYLNTIAAATNGQIGLGMAAGIRTYTEKPVNNVTIEPSPRIDHCADCGKEHGYDCPKEASEQNVLPIETK
jgi:hypothetical protein